MSNHLPPVARPRRDYWNARFARMAERANSGIHQEQFGCVRNVDLTYRCVVQTRLAGGIHRFKFMAALSALRHDFPGDQGDIKPIQCVGILLSCTCPKRLIPDGGRKRLEKMRAPACGNYLPKRVKCDAKQPQILFNPYIPAMIELTVVMHAASHASCWFGSFGNISRLCSILSNWL